MIVQLPLPYPDELFYSVIARYRAHCGMQTRETRSPMFGKGTILGVDLPSGLLAVAEMLSPTWNVTALDIACQHTLFPYYTSFNTPDVTAQILDLMLNSTVGPRRLTLRVPANGFGTRKLMYCPICRAEDLSEYGETYWRRLHQIPSVFVCETHGCYLAVSGTSVSLTSQIFFHAANGPFGEGSIPKFAKPNGPSTLVTALAERSRQVLHGFDTEWSGDDRSDKYKRRLVQLGFESRPWIVSHTRISSEIKFLFDEEVFNRLARIRCWDPIKWLPSVLAPEARRYTPPLAHVLLQVFLEQMPAIIARGISYPVGPWACPNSNFEHAEKLPIRGTFSKMRKDGMRTVTAKCHCGMHFTFSRTDDDNPYLPVVNTVRRLAPSLVLQIGELRKRGLTLQQIAVELRLPINCLKRYSQKPDLIEDLELRRKYLREEWLACLAGTPGRNRSTARNGNRGLYAELAVIDSAWLSRQGTKGKKPAKLTIADWHDRDLRWSAKLERVGRVDGRIGRSNKTPRSWFLREAGLPYWIVSRLDKLPLCKSFFLTTDRRLP